MEFGSELEEHLGKSKNPFSYSSNSSSSSSSQSSSSSLRRPNRVSLAQIYDKQHQQMGSWLGTKYDPQESSKLEFMDIVNEEEEEEEPSGGGGGVEKEHMFDKVVTPSDVGKLNRLVIPKQHAEKYFPLDSTVNEKGLLLNFEDRTAKVWRFRYSYWNSSQSYVMTKGWSRFVKDKKLDAGDIVSFQRGIGDSGKDNLYIDWRRRPDTADHRRHQYQQQQHHQYLSSSSSSIPWSPLLMRPPGMQRGEQQHLLFNRGSTTTYAYNSGTIVYMRSAVPQMVQWQQGGGGGGGAVEPMVYESVPVVVQGKAAAKRLRLFGVNMDCPINNDSEDHNQLQLKLFNATPNSSQFIHKGKSSMSFDLDI